MAETPIRLLILGAHPDDAEYHAAGLATVYREAGHSVRMISMTDGSAGHHRLLRDELAATRPEESGRVGRGDREQPARSGISPTAVEPTLELGRVITEIATTARTWS